MTANDADRQSWAGQADTYFIERHDERLVAYARLTWATTCAFLCNIQMRIAADMATGLAHEPNPPAINEMK